MSKTYRSERLAYKRQRSLMLYHGICTAVIKHVSKSGAVTFTLTYDPFDEEDE